MQIWGKGRGEDECAPARAGARPAWIARRSSIRVFTVVLYESRPCRGLLLHRRPVEGRKEEKMIDLAKKNDLLKNGGFLYDFRHQIYFNRKARKIFNIQAIEDHDKE